MRTRKSPLQRLSYNTVSITKTKKTIRRYGFKFLWVKDSAKTCPISLSRVWHLLPLPPVSSQVIHQSSETYWRRRRGRGQRATEDPGRIRTVRHPGTQTAHQDLQAETEAGGGQAVCRHPPWRGTMHATCTRLSFVQTNSLRNVKTMFVRRREVSSNKINLQDIIINLYIPVKKVSWCWHCLSSPTVLWFAGGEWCR